MLKQRPTLDITQSNQYQVRAQVDNVKSDCIQSTRDNIPELNDPHRFESAAEHLEFIDSLLPENKYLLPVAERVKGSVHGPNPMQ
jgi:16S rRNA U1498 N3-methylase RsmE